MSTTAIPKDPRWRTDESDDNRPYSHHPYAYTLSNPVNWIDATGKYACDPAYDYSGVSSNTVRNMGYIQFCTQQKATLDYELAIDSLKSPVKSRPLVTLIRLFTNPSLPGGTSTTAQSLRRNYLSPAAERLEFVLWYTQGSSDFAHDRVKFSDHDFAEEFRDEQFLLNKDGSLANSNQVNHLLSAVDLAYQFGWPFDNITRACLIGHEKLPQNAGSFAECTYGVSSDELWLFDIALTADEQGKYDLRDCLLSALLPGIAEVHPPVVVGTDPRQGDSLQDLRLGLKGWRFGKLVRNGTITTLDQARNWLALNLLPQAGGR